MISFSEPIRESGQTDVLQLACNPIETVRVAFIGLGKRGKEAFNHFMYFDRVEIIAICDKSQDKVAEVQQVLSKHKKPKADSYTQTDDWRVICERDDIDLIYVCTHRNLHTPIAVCAMQNGKHVVVEVPAANTLEECWQLVDTAEKTRQHCMMLENCCYDYFEMAVLNMVQNGVLGEVLHTEGGYIHDLRQLDFEQKPDYLSYWTMQGNPYPTHGLGPLCQLLNIHRGDRLSWLTSVSGGQFNSPVCKEHGFGSQCKLGNMNTTIIRTQKDKTIVLQHDISSPRPYSRNFLASGTNGFVQKRTTPEIALSPDLSSFLPNDKVAELLKEYEHHFYQEMGDLARKVGSHGGMDFIMDYRLIYCLHKGLPLDMDIYDAVEWSCIVDLSAQSVANGSVPVGIPDFTRGSWNKLKELIFHVAQ